MGSDFPPLTVVLIKHTSEAVLEYVWWRLRSVSRAMAAEIFQWLVRRALSVAGCQIIPASWFSLLGHLRSGLLLLWGNWPITTREVFLTPSTYTESQLPSYHTDLLLGCRSPRGRPIQTCLPT